MPTEVFQKQLDRINMRYSHAVKWMFMSPQVGQKAFLSIGLVLTACSGSPISLPKESTYPVDKQYAIEETAPFHWSESTLTVKSKEGEVRYYSGLKATSKSFVVTVGEGDSAVRDVWLIPSGSGDSNEKSLLDQIDSKGRLSCGSDYRHLDTHYYYGSEDILQSMQITSPALLVEYRCPANRYSINSNDGVLLEKWAANEDSKYFDISTDELKVSPSALVDALKKYAAANVWTLEEGPVVSVLGLSRLFKMSSKQKSPSGRVVIEQAYISIVGEESSTRFTLLFMRFHLAKHARGTAEANTEKPGFDWGLRPSYRDTTFYQSRKFAKTILSLTRK